MAPISSVRDVVEGYGSGLDVCGLWMTCRSTPSAANVTNASRQLSDS